MSAENLVNLGGSNLLSAPARIEPVEASALDVQHFDQIYNARFAQVNAPEVAQLEVPTAVQQAPAVPATDSASAVDARERARQALELEPATQIDTAGDRIIDGLQNIREIVDAKKRAVESFAASKDMDFGRMMAMQLEVAEYALVVDATSKLIGKSTQTFDSLLKSQ